MTRKRFRGALVTGYGLLVIAMATATAFFVINANRHVGADYTAAASNIVRGQQEASKLRYAAETYLVDPDERVQTRILRILETIESREGTTRNSFERLGLESGTQQAVVAEFDHVLDLLPRLRELTEQGLDDPEQRDAFGDVAMEVENSLAFVYSRIHRRNHAAAAEQQRITRLLTHAVVGLGVLLLVIIAALLWAVDKVFGQKEVLERLTVTDVLTELPNRRGLLQRAEQLLAQHRRNGEPLSLALIDLDHFKTVNDQEGHPMGDAVLQYVAGEIAGSVRASDMLARLGGEEFGLLMPETGDSGARELCERIRRHIEKLTLPMTAEVSGLTLSAGLTTATVDASTTFDRLYLNADLALYEAKRQGRNRIVTHHA